MQHLVGQTVAAVEERRKAGFDTYKDMETWTVVVLTFEGGEEITFGGSDGEVYDVFDWTDPDWPVHEDTGWPLTPSEREDLEDDLRLIRKYDGD